MNDDILLVGEVAEVRGAKVKVRVYSQANEANVFFHGGLVRGVSVGGYLCMPCGFDSVIGVVEGDYQQESRVAAATGSVGREAPGTYLERYVDVSVFGSFSCGSFSRGVEVLPLVRTKVYLLAPEELAAVNSPVVPAETGFRVGALAGHNGVDVRLPLNSLFASHIGIFGNTGSGKSNTLCRLFTDCLALRGGRGKSQFVFIDFNGEYASPSVLHAGKKVYRLSTRGGGDRIPVSEGFFFDLDVWVMLTKATEKTQRPFLRKCLLKAEKVLAMPAREAYLRGMVESMLKGYCGSAGAIFDDQREDLAELFLLIPGATREEIDEALEDIGFHSGNNNKLYSFGSGAYFDKPGDVSSVFRKLNYGSLDYAALAANRVALLEFMVRYCFIEHTRSGAIVREHIAPLVQRYSNELMEASKVYSPTGGRTCLCGDDVVVVSLHDVNLEQKKVVPLVVAKLLYQSQKTRGRTRPGSSVHLIVDEAHNILSYSSQRESESWRDYRLETFEEIVKEGRKFGMYLTVCSQRPADISPTILSQMHNYFIHRLVNDEDLRAISKAVSFIDRASASMIPVLPQGCCIVSGTATSYPARVQVDRLEREEQPASYDRDLASEWKIE